MCGGEDPGWECSMEAVASSVVETFLHADGMADRWVLAIESLWVGLEWQ